jgi:glycosyltransferase involved in cell wall biosynthesis
MTCYNGERWLAAAIDSVLCQTWGDFEFIIVDDGSTDGSAAIVRAYADGRIRYFYQANAGQTTSLNRGIAYAQGEYVAFLDADDCWLSEKLAAQVALMAAHPDAMLAFSSCYVIDQDGKIVKLHRLPPKLADDSLLEELFCEGNFIFKPTVMVRRRCLQCIGAFDPDLEFCEDYELWLRIVRHYRAAWHPYPLAMWRRHPSSKSNQGGNTAGELLLAQRDGRDPLIPKSWKARRMARVHYSCALSHFRRGNRQSCRTSLFAAYKSQRGGWRALKLGWLMLFSFCPTLVADGLFAVSRCRHRLSSL